jgi:hypothetical protein
MFLKTVSVFFIFFTLISNSFSQSNKFNIGASVGINNSKFGGVSPEGATYESVLGAGVSLIGEIRIVKNVYLSFQPSFQTGGAKIKFGNEDRLINDTVITFKINQSYFSLPLNVKIHKENFYVGFGFAYEFLSSAKIENESVGNEVDVKDKFKDYNVTSNFNVGYQLPIGKPYLFFELRYVQGLVNINNINNISKNDIYISNFKSKDFSLITGIIYPLK